MSGLDNWAPRAYRRYAKGQDPMLGFMAVFLTAMAFGLVTGILGGKRYTLFSYGSRTVYLFAYLVVLLVLVREGYALFRLERTRNEEREGLLARLVASNAQLLASSLRERESREERERLPREAQLGWNRMEEMLHLIAHDVRQPLTAARGHLQLLSRSTERGDAPRVMRSAEALALRITRLGHMIEDLVECARLEGQQVTLDRQLWTLARWSRAWLSIRWQSRDRQE